MQAGTSMGRAWDGRGRGGGGGDLVPAVDAAVHQVAAVLRKMAEVSCVK